MNAPISTKFASEVAREIKGMTLKEAEEYLERVRKKEVWVPIRRFKKKVSHKRGTVEGWKIGRYPVKVAEYFLKLIKNVRNNVEQAGKDPDSAKIVLINVGKGRRRIRRQPKGYYHFQRRKATNVEMVVEA